MNDYNNYYQHIHATCFLMSCIWNLSLQNPVDPDPGDICPGPSGTLTQYQINFQTASIVNYTSIVSTTVCKTRRCSHTFEPPSNPPSSYDGVSVAAENLVGVGAARTCTTQTISELSVIVLTRVNIMYLYSYIKL